MTQNILVDTSCLYALVDASTREHPAVARIVRTSARHLILPTPVLPELCYLIHSRLGHTVMRRFLKELAAGEPRLESIQQTDLQRIVALLDRYADAHLDFTDAAIIVVAERLGVTRILTLDRRDFSIVRPRHCDFFELLP
jgi:predicted nucleic acid-binding protein